MHPTSSSHVETAYRLARERYAQYGVDVERAIKNLQAVSISLHCWQGDDVGGFENPGQALGDGLAVTGHYPGKARSVDELRHDLEAVYQLLPGHHRLNLHAFYGEFGGCTVDRDAIGPEHFRGWIDWAQSQQLGLDFNPTFFSHPRAKDGFTLSHPDPTVRQFWVEHGIRCREIAATMGRELGTPCITNVWIPDGFKESPVDRVGPRRHLIESLDAMFRSPHPPEHQRDAVEAKLFGIGSEGYTTGSHEFYLGYAVTRQKILCLDSGHFHPTESIADKISAVLEYVPEILLHVSRGVRWDSDHVVTLDDDLRAITHELVRGDFLQRTHIGLDFFDASINRLAAWVLGARNLLRALLAAFLEPSPQLRAAEHEFDYTRRLVWLEELKTMPIGAVWDYYCLTHDVPIGRDWYNDVQRYEQRVLSNR